MTAYAHLFLIAIVLVMTFNESRGYLVDGTYSHDCLSPATCQGCSEVWGGVIMAYGYTVFACSSVGLTVFPTIHGISEVRFDIKISFNQNRIAFVPANAFQNLHPRQGQKVDINLSSNLISSVDISAFASISSNVNDLDLSNNQLSTIPSAIGSLNNLITLKLEGNPLRSVDSSVMAGIGSSLTYLDISFGHLSSWPSALGYLTSMTSLSIYDLNMELRDPSIFQGFASSLTTLNLLYSQADHGSRFHIIPDAVVTLTRLNDLTIRGEVYCTCELAYLKYWKRVFIRQDGYADMECHGSYNTNVDSYIYYLKDSC